MSKADIENRPFRFKQFSIIQQKCAMKVGTDGVLLGSWADVKASKKILDVGTGTGVIAIMLAQRTTNSEIQAVEIESEAYEEALENMKNSPWQNRLNVYHQSIQDFAKESGDNFDLIVSNPPFFSGGTFSDKQDRTSVRHTVKLPHGDLLLAAGKLLSPKGRFCVILPFIEGLRFTELAERYGFYTTKTTEVRPRKEKPVERLLIQLERENKPVVRDQLTIHLEKDDFTPEYIALTKAFYLNL